MATLLGLGGEERVPFPMAARVRAADRGAGATRGTLQRTVGVGRWTPRPPRPMPVLTREEGHLASRLQVCGAAVGTAVGAAVGAAVGQNLALQPSG